MRRSHIDKKKSIGIKPPALRKAQENYDMMAEQVYKPEQENKVELSPADLLMLEERRARQAKRAARKKASAATDTESAPAPQPTNVPVTNANSVGLNPSPDSLLPTPE